MFEARVKLEVIDIGDGPEGNRTIHFVKGGRFEGPKLKGMVVLNSGADWVKQRKDGGFHLDVRFCLETDDGALLYLSWHGRFYAAPEELEYAADQSKADDPAGAGHFHFRTAPEFETADPRYAWLNNIMAITKSRTGDGGVIHRVFAVK